VTEIQSEKEAGKLRSLKGVTGFIVSVLTFGMALFQFYTAYAGSYTPMVQRGIHLSFGLALVFLLYPADKKKLSRASLPLYDAFLAILSVVVFLFAIINFTEPTTLRMVYPTILDKLFGVIAILLVLEATRRTLGVQLLIVVMCFLLYAFIGQYVPGVFRHAGVSFSEVIGFNYMGLEGIFGTPIGASATIIFVLVVFGLVVIHLGGGEYFTQVCYLFMGNVRGGPAKIAVLASGLFGTISGVGPTNVAATGVFTIPLMKKVGYKPHFAAAVEAVASSGGQIVPPIMGAAAFLIAEVLGISYSKVCISALIPAVLYYVAVFTQVHLEAVKNGLQGLPKDEIPVEKGALLAAVLEGWNLVLPVLLLIFMIGYYESSPQRAGFYSILLLIALDMIKQVKGNKKLDIARILRAIEFSIYPALLITAVCAAVGIILSVVNVTGIGIKLTSILIALSHGSLPVLLVITMLACLLLGMGMPTAACYIIVSVLAAPALIQMGVIPIAAHLFVFYYGIISAITPPVALSAFVAAGIANAALMKTAFTSLKLGLAAFILPFMFVYYPSLILSQGGVLTIAYNILTALIGVIALSIAVEGYLFRKIGIAARVAIFFGSLLMIHGGLVTDAVGVFLILVMLAGQFNELAKKKARSLKKTVPQPDA
jgi:TRAP transporter 4TM/12TM fusion protein